MTHFFSTPFHFYFYPNQQKVQHIDSLKTSTGKLVQRGKALPWLLTWSELPTLIFDSIVPEFVLTKDMGLRTFLTLTSPRFEWGQGNTNFKLWVGRTASAYLLQKNKNKYTLLAEGHGLENLLDMQVVTFLMRGSAT